MSPITTPHWCTHVSLLKSLSFKFDQLGFGKLFSGFIRSSRVNVWGDFSPDFTISWTITYERYAFGSLWATFAIPKQMGTHPVLHKKQWIDASMIRQRCFIFELPRLLINLTHTGSCLPSSLATYTLLNAPNPSGLLKKTVSSSVLLVGGVDLIVFVFSRSEHSQGNSLSSPVKRKTWIRN